MKLNSMDLIEIFSGELFFAEKDNQVYIMDRNKCWNTQGRFFISTIWLHGEIQKIEKGSKKQQINVWKRF